jgi:nitroreductase
MIEELLRARRSVRRFRPEPAPSETILRLIDAAILAPSASNKQPWRFFVVEKRATIDAMADAVREAVDTIAAHVPPESVDAFRAYGDYFVRFQAAPTVIVPIHRGHTVLSHLVGPQLDVDARARIEAMERDSGLVGTSLALMALLLTAHELGLGASAMTGPLVAEHRLREILSIPASWGIVALVPVGWPDEEPRPTERKPVDKVVRWVR